MGDKVEQAAVLFDEDLGEAGDRRGEEPAVFNDAEATGALGDEDAAVGKEGETPRAFETFDEGFDTKRV